MRTYIIAAVLLLVAGLGAGCMGRMSGEDAEQIRALIDAQLAALDHNDLAGYMATLDPASPAYANTEKEVKNLFATFPTKSKALSFDFVTSSSYEVQVRVVQETHRVEPGYKGKRMTMIHIMRKTDGVWKMYGSQLEKDEDID